MTEIDEETKDEVGIRKYFQTINFHMICNMTGYWHWYSSGHQCFCHGFSFWGYLINSKIFINFCIIGGYPNSIGPKRRRGGCWQIRGIHYKGFFYDFIFWTNKNSPYSNGQITIYKIIRRIFQTILIPRNWRWNLWWLIKLNKLSLMFVHFYLETRA